MLQLLLPQRVYNSADDPFEIHDAPRPRTAGQVTSPNPVARLPTSHYTSSSIASQRHKRSSMVFNSGSVLSNTNYDIPHLTRTPWELERKKKNSVWRRTRVEQEHGHVLPASVFKHLPREVYDCIVDQLEQLHLGQGQSCPPCYLKDLHSLSLTSRAWDRATTLRLYRNVYVLTNEEHPTMPRLKVKGTSRLKLLRRTLRERHAHARCVRELHLSDIYALYQTASIEREEILNLVASLVMACPNLERLTGFHVPFTHSFDRLSQALSTRSELKEKVWVLGEDTGFEPDEEDVDDSNNMYYHAACDPMERFLELNSTNPKLKTLVLHQQQRQPSIALTFRAIIGTIRQFPSLRHLSLSGLPASTFTNLALNALPPDLESLRLENLHGINDKGLQRFAYSYLPKSLQSLTLVNLEISNISILSAFLSPHLPYLTDFTLSQHCAPTLPVASDIPFLASESLVSLHWEMRSQAGPPPTISSNIPSRDLSDPQFPFQNVEPIACFATSLLATSIRKGGFPSLTKIRAPQDPQGLLQAVCRPRATALLPCDKALLMSPPRHRTSSSTLSADYIQRASASLHAEDMPGITTSVAKTSHVNTNERVDSAASTPTTANFPAHVHDHQNDCNQRQIPSAATIMPLSPAQSRLQAQSRIFSARKTPLIRIQVTEPSGKVKHIKPTYGFIGNLNSNISYEVRPDNTGLRHHNLESALRGRSIDDDGCQWITGMGDIIGEPAVVGSGSGPGECRHAGRAGMGRKAISVEQLFK